MSGEFSKEADNAAREANWQGWTPPWMEGEGRGPSGPWRGPGGPRHGWGHHRWHGPRGFFGPFFGPRGFWGIPDEFLALRTEAAEVARLFAIASRGALEDKERLARLRAFLDRSHKELAEMIYGKSQGQASSEGESGSADVGQA
jgi:hypothetical protein